MVPVGGLLPLKVTWAAGHQAEYVGHHLLLGGLLEGPGTCTCTHQGNSLEAHACKQLCLMTHAAELQAGPWCGRTRCLAIAEQD